MSERSWTHTRFVTDMEEFVKFPIHLSFPLCLGIFVENQTKTFQIKIYLIIFTLHWTSIFLTIKILVKAQQFWILLHHTVVQFISWMNEWWYFKANCTLTVLKLVSSLNYISSISISNSTARLFQFPIVPFRENAQQRGLEGDFDPPPRDIFV